MYAKKEGDRWWLYFDTAEEAKGAYKKEEHNLWKDNYCCGKWCNKTGSYDFSCCIYEYRRQLTDKFTVRESFEVDDKVCWCGGNGKVKNVLSEGVVVRFCGEAFSRTFTLDGRYLTCHKHPSLFHGHDVLRPEDQRFPVVWNETEETVSVAARKLVEEIYQVITLKGIRTPLCDSNIVHYAWRLKDILNKGAN